MLKLISDLKRSINQTTTSARRLSTAFRYKTIKNDNRKFIIVQEDDDDQKFRIAQ